MSATGDNSTFEAAAEVRRYRALLATLADEIASLNDQLADSRKHVTALSNQAQQSGHMAGSATPGGLRNTPKGLVIAVVLWCVIVGGSYLATGTFLTPLSVLVALVLLPVAIAGGYQSRR